MGHAQSSFVSRLGNVIRWPPGSSMWPGAKSAGQSQALGISDLQGPVALGHLGAMVEVVWNLVDMSPVTALTVSVAGVAHVAGGGEVPAAAGAGLGAGLLAD